MKSLIENGLKVGDKVRSARNGVGTVTKIKGKKYLYPIAVTFSDGRVQHYSAYGDLPGQEYSFDIWRI